MSKQHQADIAVAQPTPPRQTPSRVFPTSNSTPKSSNDDRRPRSDVAARNAARRSARNGKEKENSFDKHSSHDKIRDKSIDKSKDKQRQNEHRVRKNVEKRSKLDESESLHPISSIHPTNSNHISTHLPTPSSAAIQIPTQPTNNNTKLRDATAPAIITGNMDEYREGCLKLEKIRHARIFEAEKRRLCSEHAILRSYETEVNAAMEELAAGCRTAVIKALQENSEKVRQVEELRYRICKDDPQGFFYKKHEMSLRRHEKEGRHDDDTAFENEKPTKRNKKNDKKEKVRVNIKLEDNQIAGDLAEMRGEKRPREDPPPPPERKSKKRK